MGTKRANRLAKYLHSTVGWRVFDLSRDCNVCGSMEFGEDKKYCSLCGAKLIISSSEEDEATLRQLEDALVFALKEKN